MNSTVGQWTGAPITRAPSITPLTGDGLLEPGTEFPRTEIRRRILSVCWRDCCLPKCFSRAPAPVVEFGEPERPLQGPRHRIAAWWLLHDGIVPENEGPHSERLRPYLNSMGRSGPTCLRYEFFLGVASVQPPGGLTLTADIAIIPGLTASSRQHLELQAATDGRLLVIARHFLPGG